MRVASKAWRLLLACCLAGVLLLSVAGVVLADEPPSGDGPGSPDSPPVPAPSVTNEYNTYNTFQFPLLGDVLKAVFGGVNEETRKAAQPGFDALSFTLKTPSLASDGQSIGGQLNFNSIVEPMWWAVLPIAGVLGFILLLLNGVQMQAGALSRQARNVGEGMQGLVAVIVGLTLAFFSLQLVHYANEGTNLLVDAIMGAGGPDSGRGLSLAAMSINMIDRVGDVSVLASIIVALILLIGALVLVAMAVARWALFFICAVLSPLALVSMGSRATGALTSLWGQLFMLVLLLGPANAIMLRSAQGLYVAAIEGSAFGLNSMAKGAVMFGLISMMGAINGMAIQRAFGVAMGWVKAGVGAITSGALLAGGATAAVMAGGGLGALTSSFRGTGSLAAPQGLRSLGPAVGDAHPEEAGPAPGIQGASQGLGVASSPAGGGPGLSEEGTEDGAGWGERFQQRRRGFDWGRASLVGGALAGMAGGPLGRTGMAVQRLGMASMVEKRYREGREERVAGRAESLAWRQESRARGDLRDLGYRRQEIYGHASGPYDVEVADAMDRAVRNVYQDSGGDVEGITKGLLALGKECSDQGPLAGNLYHEVGAMSEGAGAGREEAVERLVGSRLEAQLASRGSLRGPLRYTGAQGEPGTEGTEPQGATGNGPKGNGPNTGQGGVGWTWPSEEKGTSEAATGGPLAGASGIAGTGQQPPEGTTHQDLSWAGGTMKGKGDLSLATGNEMGAQGQGTGAGPGTASLDPVPKTIENNAVFDQAMARILGSRLGIYDGQDWAGPTPEARHLVGEQVLAEAVRLRESGQLVEGLALATKIGDEQPLEPGEAVGQLRSGIDALGPSAGSGTGSTPAASGHPAPPVTPSGPPLGNVHHVPHATPPPDESQIAVPESLDLGEQLGLDDLFVAEPDDQEA